MWALEVVVGEVAAGYVGSSRYATAYKPFASQNRAAVALL